MIHTPVLLAEVLALFAHIKQGVFIDCTLGLGGHSKALLESHKDIQLIGIDKDSDAIAQAKQNLANFQKRVMILQGSFGETLQTALNLATKNNQKVVGILADIGVSSLQLDDMERGFGFGSHNLDMRMDKSQNLNADYIVNHYSEFELERILHDYGEIKEYKKMARLIATHKDGFHSAKELSEFLARHFKHHRIHPATLAFQAIRIEVNNELNELINLLQTLSHTNTIKDTILGIISFHSLEDRIIKDSFKQWSENCICDSSVYRCECGNNHSKGKILTKKPIAPSLEEIKSNPRARSAKLRGFYFQ